MLPMTNPCPILVKRRVKNVGICENILSIIVAMLVIIRHYLLEYLEIKYDENTAPMAPVKQVEPVNSPWISPLGYSYNPKISDTWL